MGVTYSKRSTFAPSQNPYALDRDSWDSANGRVNALWAGRKNGQTTITSGSLHVWTPYAKWPDGIALEDALAQADTRYGGEWELKWDGEEMIVNPSVIVKPEQFVPWSEGLDCLLRAFPAVPAGYDGWWYRS